MTEILKINVDNEINVNKAIALAADIGVKKVEITSEQAEKLLFVMADVSKKVTLYSPVWVSLSFENGAERDCEPLYCYPLCDEYLDIINNAIRTHDKTKLCAGGLLEYLTCDDEVMDFYLQNQIAFIMPSIKVVDGGLYCVTEIGCKGTLSESALHALEQALMLQFQYDWGQDVEYIDISLPGSAITYVDGVVHFGKKEDIELKTGADVEIFENMSVYVRVYHDDFRGFDVVAD